MTSLREIWDRLITKHVTLTKPGVGDICVISYWLTGNIRNVVIQPEGMDPINIKSPTVDKVSWVAGAPTPVTMLERAHIIKAHTESNGKTDGLWPDYQQDLR